MISSQPFVSTSMFSPCQCIDVPSSSEFFTVIEIMSPWICQSPKWVVNRLRKTYPVGFDGRAWELSIDEDTVLEDAIRCDPTSGYFKVVIASDTSVGCICVVVCVVGR